VRETVDLSQARGKQVRFLDQIVSDQELRVVPRRDATLALHCMANGKALLATMPDSAIEQLVGPKLERATTNSLATLPELLAELATVRGTGFAYDRQEHSYGVCAVGIGVGPVHGRHYAVSAAVPAQRFESVLPAIRAALLICKEGIESALLAAGPSSG
jgi:DNA-binding IclR family transcriptional regulator